MIEWLFFLIGSILVMVLPSAAAMGIILASAFTYVSIGPLDITTLLSIVLVVRYNKQVITKIFKEPFLLTLGLFILWAILSIIWAENFNRWFDTIRAYIRVFLIMTIMLLSVNLKRDFLPLVWGLIVGLLYTFVGIILWEKGVISATDPYTIRLEDVSQRIYLWGETPDAIALKIAWGFIMATYIYNKDFSIKKRSTYLLFSILFILSFYMIVKLGSRAAIISLLLGFGILFIKPVLSRVLIFLTIEIILLSLLLNINFLSILQENANNISLPFATENTNRRIRNTISIVDETHRIDLWKTGLYIFRAYPFFGVGAGNVPEYYPLASTHVWNDPYFPAKRTVHNSFIMILAELGVVGVIFFLAWIWVLIKQNLSNPLLRAVVLLAFIAGATNSFEQNSLFMALIAFGYIYSRISSTDTEKTEIRNTVVRNVWRS